MRTSYPDTDHAAVDQDRALHYVSLAELAASKVPDVPGNTPIRKIDSVAVIGAGTMGIGITMCLLNVGIPVSLLEVKQEAMSRGLGLMRRNYEAQVSKGKLTLGQYEQRMSLLTTTLSYDAIADADLVIEAAYEDMDVKRQIFTTLDRIMKPGAILASNTSTLDVDKIADVTGRPGDVLGLHFFSPANVMRLLEVVRGKRTHKDVLATMMQTAQRIKKVAVVSGVCDGFIGNRMFEQYVRQAFLLVEEGATVEQVDKAAEAFGWAMGPFRVSDLAGNDIGYAIRNRRRAEQPDVLYSPVADAVCKLGRFGQKVGMGWYDYEAGKREPMTSAEVSSAIEKVRAERAVKPREIDDHEIVQRLMLALVNEGARILEEGIANRASDIDIVYLNGYGFPAYRGGPMLYADMLGLPRALELMKHFQSNPMDDAKFWEPATLLSKLASEGGVLSQFASE